MKELLKHLPSMDGITFFGYSSHDKRIDFIMDDIMWCITDTGGRAPFKVFREGRVERGAETASQILVFFKIFE